MEWVDRVRQRHVGDNCLVFVRLVIDWNQSLIEQFRWLLIILGNDSCPKIRDLVFQRWKILSIRKDHQIFAMPIDKLVHLVQGAVNVQTQPEPVAVTCYVVDVDSEPKKRSKIVVVHSIGVVMYDVTNVDEKYSNVYKSTNTENKWKNVNLKNCKSLVRLVVHNFFFFFFCHSFSSNQCYFHLAFVHSPFLLFCNLNKHLKCLPNL